MTEAEALKVVAYMRAMWPQREQSESTVSGYCDALRNVAFVDAMNSARSLVATAKWFPTVAELLAPIAERQVNMQPAEQAWLEVKNAISRWGRYRDWHFDNPATALAVDSIGKEALCNADETLVAERAHFFKIYGSYRESELTEAKTAPLLGRTYRPLGEQRIGPRPAGDVLRLVKPDETP